MDSFAARETKVFDGGYLPTPMLWIDGGGQLPYSHVVVDVSGSMGEKTFVPNYSGREPFSRSDYVMFLLLEMYQKGAITAKTRIYPHSSQSLDSFISAGFLFDSGQGPEVWPLLFAPHAGSTQLGHLTQLPHTKTLLITDEGLSRLPHSMGISQGSFQHDPPFDIIAWHSIWGMAGRY